MKLHVMLAVLICLSTAAGAGESMIPVERGTLYARSVGTGPALIVLHGGPDFDHSYLLPELDRLADTRQLIYYDQKGRGRSAAGVRPEDVSLASDIADIDSVRKHFQLEQVVLLGHSWGTVLALEYALKYPQRVSQLILMNPAPASSADVGVLRASYLKALGPEMDRQRQIVATAAYKEGDPATNTARYRIHFKPALMRPEHYELLMTKMDAAFARQGKDGIVKSRAVEDRLMLDSWQRPDYDLMPKLRAVQTRTLVIWGDHDFIPLAISEHIAGALPHAQLVTLKDCGHFTYLECPVEVRRTLDAFLGAPVRR